MRRRSRALLRRNASGKNAPENDALAEKRARVARLIRALPSGKVSSYGTVAKAAGWPGAARQVVRVLQTVPGLPWHRVLGAGGAIKLPGENGAEQKFRLRLEGVTFRGARVDMKRHEFKFPQAVPSTKSVRSTQYPVPRTSKSVCRGSKSAPGNA